MTGCTKKKAIQNFHFNSCQFLFCFPCVCCEQFILHISVHTQLIWVIYAFYMLGFNYGKTKFNNKNSSYLTVLKHTHIYCNVSQIIYSFLSLYNHYYGIIISINSINLSKTYTCLITLPAYKIINFTKNDKFPVNTFFLYILSNIIYFVPKMDGQNSLVCNTLFIGQNSLICDTLFILHLHCH